MGGIYCRNENLVIDFLLVLKIQLEVLEFLLEGFQFFFLSAKFLLQSQDLFYILKSAGPFLYAILNLIHIRLIQFYLNVPILLDF